MIKFFRQIRLDLMAQNRSERPTWPAGRYIKYAIGEIVLVVIGILIALQINNWNEKQKLEAKKQDYYLQLLDDLNSDIAFANQTIEKFNQYLEDFEAYTSSFDKGVLSPNEIYEQIAKLPVISTSLTFNSSTIETLQNSGDVGLIPAVIRNKLIDLRRQQDLIIKRAEYTDAGKNGIIQNLNPLLGSTTLPGRLEKQPEVKAFFDIDKNRREIILVYEGIHRWKSSSELETKNRLEDMLREIDTIVALIHMELEK
ncbi:MAG: DUF6090 family protein [Lutimonas sp.]